MRRSYQAHLYNARKYILSCRYIVKLRRVKCGSSTLGRQDRVSARLSACQDFTAGLFRRSGFSSSSPQWTRGCCAAILAAFRFGACSRFQKLLRRSDRKHVWTGGYSRRPRGKFASALVKFSRARSHLTPHRRSAYRATPKHSNRYLRSHPHKNTMDRK